MTIQIGFIKKNDFLGRVIKYFSKGIYSHAFLILNHHIIAETDFIHNFRVRLNPYKKCDYDVVTLVLKPIQVEEMYEWISEHNKTPYDNLENWRYLLGNKKSNDKSKLNCIESIVDCLCDCGFLNPLYYELNLSPTELYNILSTKQI